MRRLPIVVLFVFVFVTACAGTDQGKRYQTFEEKFADVMTEQLVGNLHAVPRSVSAAYGKCSARYAVSAFSPEDIAILDTAVRSGHDIPQSLKNSVAQAVAQFKKNGISKTVFDPFCPNDTDDFVKYQLINPV